MNAAIRARERLRALFQAFVPCPFEEDWEELSLRQPVTWTGETIEDLAESASELRPKQTFRPYEGDFPYPDLELDWDDLRQPERKLHYVALWDEAGQLIPGTFKRFPYSLPDYITVVTWEPATATHIGTWSPTEPTPKLVKLSEPVRVGKNPTTALYCADGHVGYKPPPNRVTTQAHFNTVNIAWNFPGSASTNTVTITSYTIGNTTFRIV